MAFNLHVEGSTLMDENGTSVRLTGVNWYNNSRSARMVFMQESPSRMAASFLTDVTCLKTFSLFALLMGKRFCVNGSAHQAFL
jgi:hypothetical protein